MHFSKDYIDIAYHVHVRHSHLAVDCVQAVTQRWSVVPAVKRHAGHLTAAGGRRRAVAGSRSQINRRRVTSSCRSQQTVRRLWRRHRVHDATGCIDEANTLEQTNTTLLTYVAKARVHICDVA